MSDDNDWPDRREENLTAEYYNDEIRKREAALVALPRWSYSYHDEEFKPNANGEWLRWADLAKVLGIVVKDEDDLFDQ